MASTSASVSRSGADTAGEVSLVRLYVLRATYVLLVVGLGLMIVPELFSHEPMARGVIPSLLGAVWLLAFVGLRYPLQMRWRVRSPTRSSFTLPLKSPAMYLRHTLSLPRSRGGTR